LQWGGETEYWVTGNPVEEPGIWKFTPMPPRDPVLATPRTFIVQVVRSEADDTPLSAPHQIDYQGCGVGKELFLNIIFDEL